MLDSVEIFEAAVQALMVVTSAWLMVLLGFQLAITFFGFKRNTKDYQDHPPQMRFLVLVPAHNEEAVIGDIIDNLQHMEYPKELYDFYILADNCTDGTVRVAREMGANVLEFTRKSPDAPTGKPIVLQQALEMLDGYEQRYDLVMFFDSDNLVDTNMFLEVNSQYLSTKADIIQCYLGIKNRKGMVALFYYMTYTITNRFFQYAKSRLGLNSVIGGTGFAVSAKYLYERGGWTAMSLTEDFELQIAATCEGRRIIWNNNVRIYDEKPTRFRASFRQRTRWAQGHWYVAFKNTPKLFRALKDGTIGFWEFVSTFLYAYSLTPYVILVLQLGLGLLLGVFRLAGWLQSASPMVTPLSWLTNNLPSILLFLYSFVFLFYMGERLDNHARFDIKVLLPMLWSMLINTMLAGWAQVVGLFKHRRQSNWVKTEHSIHHIEDMTVRLGDVGIGREETPSPEEGCDKEPLDNGMSA